LFHALLLIDWVLRYGGEVRLFHFDESRGGFYEGWRFG
jgi:hypothetical protein